MVSSFFMPDSYFKRNQLEQTNTAFQLEYPSTIAQSWMGYPAGLDKVSSLWQMESSMYKSVALEAEFQ